MKAQIKCLFEHREIVRQFLAEMKSPCFIGGDIETTSFLSMLMVDDPLLIYPEEIKDFALDKGIPLSVYISEDRHNAKSTLHVRFTPQGENRITYYEDHFRNPDIEDLINIVQNIDLLVKTIQEHFNNVTPLPWHNQNQYGKIYLAKKLLLDEENLMMS